MRFEVVRTIRFADVDPAGIVFYPRYFEMLNSLVEDWFGDCLGADFAEMTLRRKRGVPLVKINLEFTKPSLLYDEVTFALDVLAMGSSSVTLDVHARCGDELRLRGKMVLVHYDTITRKAIAWSDDLRQAIEGQLPAPVAGAVAGGSAQP